MYIREVTVRNYSIHQDTKVSLDPITMFVGPNGGGKSALLDALVNFSNVTRGKIPESFPQY